MHTLQMVTIVRWVNTSITSIVSLSVTRAFEIYSPSNFQLYDTVCLTTVTRLYLAFQELTRLRTGSLYPDHLHPFPPHTPPPPPALATTSPLCFHEFGLRKVLHRSEITQCLFFSVLLSAQCPQVSSMLSQMAGFPSFYGWTSLHCIYRVGQSWFTVVRMESNNKNRRITSVFCILTTVNLRFPHPVYTTSSPSVHPLTDASVFPHLGYFK